MAAMTFERPHLALPAAGRFASLFALALAVVLAGACAPEEAPEPGPPPAGAGEPIERPSSQEGVAPPSEVAFEGTFEPIEVPRPQAPVAVLTAVETGRHQGFDRVVFELGGDAVGGYEVRYLDGGASACGSGDPVETAGAAQLQVTLRPAAAHTDEGRATVEDRARRPDLPALAELRLTCDFEADVTWVLGVAEKAPYRVLELGGPARLVVDVRHPEAADAGNEG